MAATRRSSGSSVVCPLSSSQKSLNHQRSSASFCNINLCLKKPSHGNIPKPSASSVVVPNHQKRKCMCSPTTHPGSFRCAYHRRLEKEKIGTLNSSAKQNSSGNTNTTSNSGLNLRKLALMNSLAKIATVEAERFRNHLASTMVKPSAPQIRPHHEFRPRPSRFYAMHKDQD